MQVGQNTTFAQVHQEFASGKATPGRLAGKHLRFDGANKLYTHSSSPFVISNKGQQAAIERAKKHEKGALMVLQSIDNQYGPGYGDKIFKNIAAQHHVDLDKGVTRRDLNLIQQTIAQDQAIRARALHAAAGSTPVGFQLTTADDASARLQGTFDGASIQQIQRGFDSGIVTNKNQVEQGFPTVSQVFWKDHVSRNNRLSVTDQNGTTPLVKGGHPEPRQGLRAFTGSDASALSLSHYLNQDIAHALLVGEQGLLKNGSDDPLLLDAGRKTNYAVTKSGNDYLIDVEIEGPIRQIMGGEQALVGDPSQSSVSYSMQLKVSQAALDAGNGNYQVTQAPSYDIQFKPDWQALTGG